METEGAARKDNTSNNNIWGVVGRVSFCTWILFLMCISCNVKENHQEAIKHGK